MLPLLHLETGLGFRDAASGPPFPAIVNVSRHERGSFPPKSCSRSEHPSTLEGLYLSKAGL